MKHTHYIKLTEKAKEKRDGVYSLSGELYAVLDHLIVLYQDGMFVMQVVHGFSTKMGRMPSYDKRKEFLRLLGELS